MTQSTEIDLPFKPALPPAPNGNGSMLDVIERAARDPHVDMTKLRELLEMQERVLAREARTQFYRDFATLQNELPVIEKRGRIKFNKQDEGQPFAKWEDINEAIKPVLQAHGFSLSFRTGFANDRVMVTGILSHRDGHAEETTLPLPLDGSGSKNAVQAVGSSTSYGKRYVASALLNLTLTDEDDDGRSAVGGAINDDQVEHIFRLLRRDNADQGRFLKYLGQKIGMELKMVADIPAKHFNTAIQVINERQAKVAEKAKA